MHRVEEENDIVVYVADLDLTSWTRRCLRRADLVLLVTTGGGDGEPTEAESVLLWASESALRPQVDLVAVHSRSTVRPSGTSRLLFVVIIMWEVVRLKVLQGSPGLFAGDLSASSSVEAELLAALLISEWSRR